MGPRYCAIDVAARSRRYAQKGTQSYSMTDDLLSLLKNNVFCRDLSSGTAAASTNLSEELSEGVTYVLESYVSMARNEN